MLKLYLTIVSVSDLGYLFWSKVEIREQIIDIFIVKNIYIYIFTSRINKYG